MESRMSTRFQNFAFCLVFALTFNTLLGNTAFGGITDVARTGSSANCEPNLGGDLVEDSLAYCDQAYTWNNLPPEAEGVLLDYIVVSDADSAVPDYGLSITVDLPGTLLLFIDPSIDVVADMPWVVSDGFVKEDGINFTLDQGGPTVVHDLWVRDIKDTANPLTTGPQNNGTVSNYGVAYATDASDLAISIVGDPNPYVLGSGALWTRTYTVENLGYSDIDEIVVSLSGTGINDSTFVSLVTSPNSSFNDQGQFRWRMTTLTTGEKATLTITRVLGAGQTVGTNVITSNAQIESYVGYDPDLGNNSASIQTSVLDVAFAINSVTRLGTSTNCEPYAAGTLTENALAYCDQSFTWTNIPPEADGTLLDYVVVSDSDGALADYGLALDVGFPGSMLLFIDPVIDVATEMPWVIADGYQKEEGITLTLDQGGAVAVHDLWSRDINDPELPVILGAQNNGAASNYGVAYATDTADLAVSIEAEPNPYDLNVGGNWVRTYTIENLGATVVDAVVVSINATGINDSTFVSLETSPNSTFNSLGEFKWRMPFLEVGESANLTLTRTFGPNQQTGVDVVTSGVQIDSADRFDPVEGNNSASVSTTIIGEILFSDSFEE
jgi:hypothetical protein